MPAQALDNPNRRDEVSAEEWQLRVDLAAAYRLVALFGWDDLVFTHISARLPGASGEFLINPYGLMFEEVTASSLIKVGHAGEKLCESRFSVNPAGFVIHSAVHAARPDAHCVMHLHTSDGVAVSAQRHGVLPLSQQSMFVLASLGYHDYEGVALRDEEKPRLVRDLADHRFLMLRNHGLLTVGASVADAFLSMYLFERTCEIQLRALAGATDTVQVPADILAGAHAQAEHATRGLGGALAWPGLLRRLDRQLPGYD
ncbi:MAG: class II aldolase/adducin family protein, partial [Rubrivivax sp.]|nr:class II aldolase/adducin family protein [Rubrivivax sp.]